MNTRLAWRDVDPGMLEWRFDPGAIAHPDAADTSSLLQSTTPFDLADLTLEVGVTFATWDVAGATVAIKIDTGLDMEDGHGCALDPGMPAPGKHRALLFDETIAGSVTTFGAPIPALTDTTPITITLRRRLTGELGCRVVIAGEIIDLPSIVRASSTQWPPPRYLAILAERSAFKVNWMTIYRSP
jgi:hypothetical protein